MASRASRVGQSAVACARLAWDHGRVPHFLAKDDLFVGLAGTILRAAGQLPVSALWPYPVAA